jgi:hypothetical protein
MFLKKYGDRLRDWRDFRQSLEACNDPYRAAIDFYKTAPTVSFNADPYEQETWPGPWELIEENQYCEFCKLLGICYSLQLTERFSTDGFEIHITLDKEKSQTNYLLQTNGYCIGYEPSTAIPIIDLPHSLAIEKRYVMPYLR